MARKSHDPTDIQRREVSAYAAVGTPHHSIAKLVGLSIKTLLKHYRDELDTGKARANAQVGKTLFQQAIGGNTTAAIFWMKAQAGWTDRLQIDGQMEVTQFVVRAPEPAKDASEWLKSSSGSLSPDRRPTS